MLFLSCEFSFCLIYFQATLGSGESTEKSILQCEVGDKAPIYLCSLLPDRRETCPLNLEFEEDEKVTFSIVGPQSVHLSGFFYGDESEDEDESDEDGYGWYPCLNSLFLVVLHIVWVFSCFAVKQTS